MDLSPIPFLQKPSMARLRREIQNIVDSYSHPWDVLAELTQNSVDAIRRHRANFGTAGQATHAIGIVIDRRDRSITVTDTGVGFDPDRLAELLAPGGTDKSGLPDQIGEKGVGLTYTLFVCNAYMLRTRSTAGEIDGQVQNGLSWRKALVDDEPQFQITKWEPATIEPSATGTAVVLSGIEAADAEEEDIFSLSLAALEYILRTKTAIGYLKHRLTSDDMAVAVSLTLVATDGTTTSLEVPFEYMWPDNLLAAGGSINLDDFRSRAAALDDKQKAKELAGKAIVKVGSEVRAGRTVNYYAFFAPSRTLWKEISQKNQLVTIDSAGLEHPLYAGSVSVGSRGMPTGIELDPPATGYAGYWPNFLMLFEDDAITFDVGRKAVPGRTKGMLRDLAKSLFDEFLPFATYATKDPAAVSGTNASLLAYAKQRTFEEMEKLSDLGIKNFNYIKHPDGQEAAVVALFHELVGASVLAGYQTYRTGYRETYDMWGWYRIPVGLVGANQRQAFAGKSHVELPVVLEFKFAAESILKDFDRDIKFFNDIDLLVCWDLNPQEFKKQSVKVEALSPDDVLFFGSNYKLVWPGAYNLGPASEKPVLALRDFVKVHTAT